MNRHRLVHPFSRAISVRQRGAGVLPVALILLAGAALILLFAQRNLLLDWRMTQQGYTHRLAYAAAESGLAVVMAKLNDPVQRALILADKKGTGAYDTVLAPVHQVPVGASLSASVSIKGLSLGQSDIRLQLQSTGCVDDCTQGRAIVSQALAMRGGIHRIPYALMSTRGALTATGSATLSNQSAAVRGMLLHTGKEAVVDESVIQMTLPGQQPVAARVLSDRLFSSMSPGQFFQYWFGADKTAVQNTATRVRCNGECGATLAVAGSRVLWIDGNARLSSGVIGTASAPVVMIASGALEITGGARVTGVVYSMASQTRLSVTQGGVEGAVIAEQDLSIETAGSYRYNPIVLQIAQTRLGRFEPIPGSWSDGE